MTNNTQEKTTLDEYLAKRGLSSIVCDYMIDKLVHPHGLTTRQRRKLEKNAAKAQAEYEKKRSAAIDEYHRKHAAGEIVEKSRKEQLIEKANGHPDNESTQAARRLCAKYGISWENN